MKTLLAIVLLLSPVVHGSDGSLEVKPTPNGVNLTITSDRSYRLLWSTNLVEWWIVYERDVPTNVVSRVEGRHASGQRGFYCIVPK